MPIINIQNRKLQPMIERIIAGDLLALGLANYRSTPENGGVEVGLG
jgi:hypothetical protein